METSSEPLIGALIKRHVELLREADDVDTLQRKFDLLFGVDGAFTNDDGSDDEMEDEDVEVAKQRREKYKNQKLRFRQIQRLLKSTQQHSSDHPSFEISSFYSRAWPAACVLVAPIVRSIRHRTQLLLIDFEDHPSLVKVLELVRSSNLIDIVSSVRSH